MLTLVCRDCEKGFSVRKNTHKFCRPCYKKNYGTGRPIEGRKRVIRPKRQPKVVSIQSKRK